MYAIRSYYAAAFVAWGFALYVFVVAPPTRGARFLIAMLLVDGLAVITSYNNLLYVNPLLASLGLPLVPGELHQVSDWAVIAVYLPFVGMTLSSPLANPLKHPRITSYNVCYTKLLRAIAVVRNGAIIESVERDDGDRAARLAARCILLGDGDGHG